MGYTHYWLGKKSTDANWNEFTAACKKLHANLPANTNSAGGYHEDDPLEIAGGDGDGEPFFGNRTVCFNGKDDARDLGHETFRIDKNPAEPWNFCKTARKPYDLLVVACLIAAWQILDYRFSSDGFTDYEEIKECNDLIPGMEYYNKVMKPEMPITEGMLWKQRAQYHQRQGRG
jgi:ABC-type glycerol-3-phosphate transport system substrate-binding protein